MNWETEMDINTLLCIKQITNENRFYNVVTEMGRKFPKRERACICVADPLCYTAKTNITP